MGGLITAAGNALGSPGATMGLRATPRFGPGMPLARPPAPRLPMPTARPPLVLCQRHFPSRELGPFHAPFHSLRYCRKRVLLTRQTSAHVPAMQNETTRH